jgi:hypothetical protein
VRLGNYAWIGAGSEAVLRIILLGPGARSQNCNEAAHMRDLDYAGPGSLTKTGVPSRTANWNSLCGLGERHSAGNIGDGEQLSKLRWASEVLL